MKRTSFLSIAICIWTLSTGTALAEPGHPVATLVAYRPIPPIPPILWPAAAGAQEGMLTLEFSSPNSSATDPVTVSVSDLNHVVRQTDTNVIVPSLPSGDLFRVAIALGVDTISGDDPNGGAWLKRYAKGISLHVETAKLQSSFGQQQALLTSAAAKCVDQGCAPATPPFIAKFRPNDPLPSTANFQCPNDPIGLTAIGDENIAAGQGLLYLEDQNNFAVYDKKARQYGPICLTNTNLSANTAASQVAWKAGGDATLFQNFWWPGSALSVNPGAIPQGPIPCTTASPKDLTGGVFPDPNAPGLSATSCINQFYDARLTYDAGRGRFWLVSHAANDFNPSAKCNPSNPPPPLTAAEFCQKANAQLAHQVFVAVSNSEAPSAGFLTFKGLDNANDDWELMGVQGRYLLISYVRSFTLPPQVRLTPVHLYDADALTQGVLTDLGAGLSPANFGYGTVRMPKHHKIKHDIAFIVSTLGYTLNLYAWNAATGPPKLLGPAIYADHDAKFDTGHDGYQSVIRGNDLYVITTDGTRVHVWRIPYTLRTDGVVGIDANHVNKWVIQQSNLNFDYPTIEVTRNGDIVVAFRAWNTNLPDQFWVDVLYHGETQFRQSLAISKPAKQQVCHLNAQNQVVCTPGSRIDFISSSIDPTDDETVWISSVDGTGPIVTSVRP